MALARTESDIAMQPSVRRRRVIAGWSPQQTTKMIADEYARWAEVTRKAGIAGK